jgi:hypothetical protein
MVANTFNYSLLKKMYDKTKAEYEAKTGPREPKDKEGLILKGRMQALSWVYVQCVNGEVRD